MFSKLIPLLFVVPAIVGAQQPVTPIAPLAADTTFKPISMADAVHLAKENNVANINASNAIRLANNNVRAARGAFFPTLTATAGQNKSAGQRLGQQGQLVDYTPGWTYNTALTSNITLFDGGKMFADVKTQKANVVAAEATQVSTEFNTGLQVKLAYNAILAAKESESAAQAQLAAAQAQLEVSVAKVNAGAANVSDSLRSIVQVGNARLAILTAQNDFRTQSANLTHLVGTPYFVTAVLADTVEPPPSRLDSASILQMALTGPSIRQAEAELQSFSAAERSAKSAYLPTLALNLNYSGNGNGPYGFGGNPFPYYRGVGLNVSYPIFNRFTRENNIASAQISYDNALAQLKDQRLAAQQNVVTDFATLRNAEETMRVQETNVRASEEDLRVQQQRYNLGASVLLDVLNSQLTLVQARQSLIQARYNYRNARAQIEAAIGRDLP